MRNEVILDAVVLLDVVDEFDDDRVFGLIEVDVRRGGRILRGEQELEADRPHSILQFNREFASEHDHIILLLAREANGDDGGLHSIVPSQEGVQILS